MKTLSSVKWVLCGCATLLLTGCALMGARQVHRANSLYKFLYANQSEHKDTPLIPTLSLPLRVGVAFVPTGEASEKHGFEPDDWSFTERDKLELLRTVSAQFRGLVFVKNIEIIPSTYLTPSGGFANLDQLQRIYGIDVMALVSYDQAQFTDEGVASIVYWTIVGAYFIPAEKNETITLLDAAVYDIASRQLLFRAPGTSRVKNYATAFNETEGIRKDSAKGFTIAATNLVQNLQIELQHFQERVKESPTDYKIVHKPGYVSAGAFGYGEALTLIGVAGLVLFRPRAKAR